MRSDPQRVGRTAVAIVSTTLLAAGTLAAPVAALPSPPIGPCDPGTQWYTVEGNPSFALTHVTGYQAPPGGEVTVTRTAELVRTLTASVEAGVEAKVSAGAILAKAESKYHVTLAAAGTVTKKTTESLSYRVSSSTKDRYYALYSGRRYWSGVWKLNRCANNGQSDYVIDSGNWSSFQANIEGGALCPATRYKKGTLAFKACKTTWN